MGGLLLNLAMYILDLTADPFFLLVVFIVGLQYYRLFSLHKQLHGTYHIQWGYIFAAILLGIAAGYLGSILLVLIGISIDLTGPMYLWTVALVLFLFQQRMMCFAYSGGLISLCCLLTGFPQVSVPQVLGLVAVLHLVEACLIWVSGHWDPVPVYSRRPDGKLVGAFVLQKFWPLPLVALANVYVSSAAGGVLLMPGWWPVLLPKGLAGMVLALTTLPAALGYGDIAVSSTPRQRARLSALQLALYSFTLLCLSYLSTLGQAFAYTAALFSPLGHELVISLSRRREWGMTPLFQQEEHGVKVLETLRDSPAFRAGIRRGDTILRLNDHKVFTRDQLADAVARGGQSLDCAYLCGDGTTRACRVVLRGKRLGVITVPERQDRVYVELAGAGPLLQQIYKFVPKSRF